jgi:hypothetical protein
MMSKPGRPPEATAAADGAPHTKNVESRPFPLKPHAIEVIHRQDRQHPDCPPTSGHIETWGSALFARGTGPERP